MKNIGYIVLLLFVLPLTGLAQNDSIVLLEKEQPTTDDPRYNNQIDLDMEFIGASFGYKHRLYNNWFVGGRIGGGGIYSKLFNGNGSFSSPNIEIFHSQILLEYSISGNLFFDIGTRFAIFYDGDVYDKLVQFIVGGYIGFNKIQFGIRLGVLGRNIEKPDIYTLHSTSLIIVKIPLKRW